MAATDPARPRRRDAPAEPLYEAAFHALADPAAVLDEEARVLTVNSAFEALFGPGPWRGLTLDGLFGDPLDAHAAPWRRASGRARAFRAALKPAQGADYPAEIDVTPLAEGGLLAVLRRDEGVKERLEANRARLTETFAAPKAGAFGMDLRAGEGQVSGFLAHIFGVPDDDGALSREAWLAGVEPGDRAAIEEAIAAASGRPFAAIRFTVRVRDAETGAVRALRHDLTAAALDQDGRPVRLTGAVADVTDLAAETRAREDAERELDLAATLGGLTRWSYDPETGRGRIDGALTRLIGGPDFSPRRWIAQLGSEEARRLEAALCAAEYGGSVDLRIRPPGGPVCILRGERRHSGLIAGFAQAEPAPEPPPAPAPAELHDDAGEAAASARMSAWTYEIATRRLRLTGPVLDLLGLPTGEHVMDILDWRERAPEEDRVQMDRATETLDTHGVADVEYRVRAEDGRLVWLSLRGGVSEQDADGRPLRYSGFLAEIGARKRLERQLAARERQLADAVDAGLIGIWAYDYATRVQTARGKILDWIGRPRDADRIEERDWLTVVHPDDLDALRAAFATMAAGGPVDRLDLRLKTPDGWRWARTHGAPISAGPDAAPQRAAGVIVDIHAERALDQALRSEKARFEAVYRRTPALLHSIDAEGRTLSVSDYWLERMGYDREAVIGAPGWAFMDTASAARIREEVIPRTLDEGGVENEPVVGITAAGERLDLRLSAFLETDAAGRPVAAHGVFSDVTDLKAIQRQLEDHAGALERSNRELDRFATVASHDLQEPLRKISAFASLLRRRLSPDADPETEQALAFLVDAAGRMRGLIDDLLAYSRASNRPLELRAQPLDPLIARILAGLDMQIAEAEADVRTEPLPTVTGDSVLLGLLFQNLITNALKYRKETGVTVTLSARTAADGMAAVTVADDGIGFDPKFARKIFEPFARLHGREAYSGTGIGLAICQQAAERMGGRIEVASKPGKGSAFTVFLPPA